MRSYCQQGYCALQSSSHGFDGTSLHPVRARLCRQTLSEAPLSLPAQWLSRSHPFRLPSFWETIRINCKRWWLAVTSRTPTSIRISSAGGATCACLHTVRARMDGPKGKIAVKSGAGSLPVLVGLWVGPGYGDAHHCRDRVLKRCLGSALSLRLQVTTASFVSRAGACGASTVGLAKEQTV